MILADVPCKAEPRGFCTQDLRNQDGSSGKELQTLGYYRLPISVLGAQVGFQSHIQIFEVPINKASEKMQIRSGRTGLDLSIVVRKKGLDS